jgi:hypothetical protein
VASGLSPQWQIFIPPGFPTIRQGGAEGPVAAGLRHQRVGAKTGVAQVHVFLPHALAAGIHFRERSSAAQVREGCAGLTGAHSLPEDELQAVAVGVVEIDAAVVAWAAADFDAVAFKLGP